MDPITKIMNMAKEKPAIIVLPEGSDARTWQAARRLVDENLAIPVVIGTPMDLNRIVKINKPNTRVHYDLQEIGFPNLEGIIDDFVEKNNLKK